MAVQPDGKIVVGGNFWQIGTETHVNIGRLNADGTVDSGFTVSANGEVRALAVQKDGKF